ncbi:MAG: hypothetical protein HY925_10155 [Elusimicrobia bacterium]|nr:hypothetical protein [Elusimicrobiota bacterium]
MKTIESITPETEVRTNSIAAPTLRRHDRKRLSTWKVLGSTVAGFPAFLWQLTRSHHS